MTPPVCVTIDVEDWYDGMEVLGVPVPKPDGARSGLTGLVEHLEATEGSPKVTLFVVGNYADEVSEELAGMAKAGHEIASHGPDHGRLPEDPAALVEWLRSGKEGLEDRFQVPVRGFRSPRFDRPSSQSLEQYREAVAEAGFEYVSDTHVMGKGSPVTELPVLVMHGFPIGGGSYQRLMPASVASGMVGRSVGPAVVYYHSYDFDATLPTLGSIRSVAEAKQLVGRGRVERAFSKILSRYGSKACVDVQR